MGLGFQGFRGLGSGGGFLESGADDLASVWGSPVFSNSHVGSGGGGGVGLQELK